MADDEEYFSDYDQTLSTTKQPIYPIPESAILLQIQLVDAILEKMKLRWQGITGYDKNKKPIKNARAVMNELGAESIITTIYSAIHENSNLSDFTQDEIEEIGIATSIAIATDIKHNHEKYAIDKRDRTIIMNSVRNLLLTNLKKAKAGSMFKTLNRGVARNENANVGGIEGLFNKFIGGNKR